MEKHKKHKIKNKPFYSLAYEVQLLQGRLRAEKSRNKKQQQSKK